MVKAEDGGILQCAMELIKENQSEIDIDTPNVTENIYMLAYNDGVMDMMQKVIDTYGGNRI